MAGSDSLIAVNPDRFSELVEAFAVPEPSEAWLRGLFKRFGVRFEHFWESDYAEELSAPENRTQVFNQALAALAGDGECFDTSLDLLVSIVAQRNPDLDPLRSLIADLDFDVVLPVSVQPVEYGLLGLWSATRTERAFTAARRFASRDGVRQYFAGKSYGVAEKLSGVPRRDRALEREWLEEDFWATWKEFLNLGSRAGRDGSHLALVSWD